MKIIPTTNNFYNDSYKGHSKNEPADFVEKFIHITDKVENQKYKGTFISRNLGCNTSMFPLYAVLGAEVYASVREKHLKQVLSKAEFRKKEIKHSKIINGLLIASIPLAFIINKIITSKSDENYKKLKEKFNNLNTDTNAKLNDRMIYSSFIGASYSGMSGVISINKNIVNDPISRIGIEKIIKHELVHAKQFETVARSKDGIKKVNFAIMTMIYKNIQRKPDAIKVFEALYNTIQNDKTNKYKDKTITVNNAKINLKDYITSLHILINNKNANYNDIPIVIKTKYYEEVIEKKGTLTPEEETKAEEYFKAMLEYTSVNRNNALNPFSNYRQNLLEKEAYKENPPLYKRLFG